MYAICSVAQDDVLKAVQTMVKNKYSFPVLQFSEKEYTELEQNRALVPSVVQPIIDEGLSYVINKNTKTLHTHDCLYQGMAANTFPARILYEPRSGLRVCRHCLK